jgi:hypothetical protein
MIYHHFADLRQTVMTTAQLQHDYRVGLLSRDEFITESGNAAFEPGPLAAVLTDTIQYFNTGVDVQS